ncbi:MAG TPA: OmpH family outer membrane protein, partial [Gammaproteobacteria bacterium]|nr:OmpH family outer membrane protein [Gammaproteobacteria bacterium]
ANVQTELLKAIQAVAQAQAFDIVLPDSAVVFISNRVDITQQVIDYIKKASPAAPAKANP